MLITFLAHSMYGDAAECNSGNSCMHIARVQLYNVSGAKSVKDTQSQSAHQYTEQRLNRHKPEEVFISNDFEYQKRI